MLAYGNLNIRIHRDITGARRVAWGEMWFGERVTLKVVQITGAGTSRQCNTPSCVNLYWDIIHELLIIFICSECLGVTLSVYLNTEILFKYTTCKKAMATGCQPKNR